MNRLTCSLAKHLSCWTVSLALSVGAVLPLDSFAQGLDSIGSAFRPQAASPHSSAANTGTPVRPATGASAASVKDADDITGLRVVVTSGARSLASIDGRIVRVGDSINGMRVTQIGPQGVLLRGEAGTREQLTLNPSALKKPANSTRVSTGVRP